MCTYYFITLKLIIIPSKRLENNYFMIQYCNNYNFYDNINDYIFIFYLKLIASISGDLFFKLFFNICI